MKKLRKSMSKYASTIEAYACDCNCHCASCDCICPPLEYNYVFDDQGDTQSMINAEVVTEHNIASMA